jgi:virulence-associated protein VapD
MYAIAFDLVVKDVLSHHPMGNAAQAYADIKRVLVSHGFEWRQGSVYTLDDEDMAKLFAAMVALQWSGSRRASATFARFELSSGPTSQPS